MKIYAVFVGFRNSICLVDYSLVITVFLSWIGVHFYGMKSIKAERLLILISYSFFIIFFAWLVVPPVLDRRNKLSEKRKWKKEVCFIISYRYLFVVKALLNHNVQSPEVTSKAAASDEDLNDTVTTLSDKLSEALLNIRAKEDLVKQHAKVAEEAVSGINCSLYSMNRSLNTTLQFIRNVFSPESVLLNLYFSYFLKCGEYVAISHCFSFQLIIVWKVVRLKWIERRPFELHWHHGS